MKITPKLRAVAVLCSSINSNNAMFASSMTTAPSSVHRRQASSRITCTSILEELSDSALDELLKQLTPEEIEVAARASYEYLLEPKAKYQSYYAKLFAQRYVKARDGDTKTALQGMKKTLQFRSKMDVDGLRTAFDKTRGNLNYAKRLWQEMQSKNVYVQGYDKEGRSTYVFIPRNVQSHDKEWTLKQHVYTLERALAATKAPDKTVNAMVDFNGFSHRCAPPTQVGKEFMVTLRNHYASAIHNIYLIDVPTSFLCVWTLFKPLLGKKTRNKIHFVQSKKNGLSKYYYSHQAASWMMRNGKKNRELDAQEYLYKTPFHCPFDG